MGRYDELGCSTYARRAARYGRPFLFPRATEGLRGSQLRRLGRMDQHVIGKWTTLWKQDAIAG